MKERTRVQLEGCRCPGSPHRDGDWVELAPRATPAMGTAIMAAVRGTANRFNLEGYMAEAYLTFGIRAWSFTDEDGDNVPVDPIAPDWRETVEELLPWADGGVAVVEKADALYSEEVLRPLLSRTSTSSQAGQMDGSTSHTQPTGPKHPKQSTPSSPASSEDGSTSEDPGQ